MPDSLAELKQRLEEISDLRTVTSVLEWDQLVMMPPGGAANRAHHVATVRRLAHERFVDDAIGELLAELRSYADSLPADDDDACLIRVTARDWDKARRVPPALEAELARVASEANEAWVAARAASDYSLFRPWLDRTLELKQRYLECFAPTDDPYDVFLDDFEPGMRTDEVRAVFDRLKPELIELVLSGRDLTEEPFVRRTYPVAAQEDVSRELMAALGFTPGSFRLDPTVHPFCMHFGTQDIRLTTRYATDDLHGTSLFSTLHEAGHGLYEHGVSPTLERTPLGSGCSSALHESQSRLWENVIGRSLPFWRWFYPRLQGAFPDALGDVPLDAYHRAVNRVRASFIRVDADETSYGLHIILRFELEQELLSGRLSTADLPDAWNAGFEASFGIPVPEDRVGCLQDVHWSAGLFGYFPTYQLGNVLSVQIWEALVAEVPDAYDQVEQGRFAEIGGWLRENLYALGRKHTPVETIARVAGGPLDPEPYLRYLREKNASLAAA